MKSIKLILSFIFLVFINAFVFNAYLTNLISTNLFASLFGILLFLDLLTLFLGFVFPTWSYIKFNFSNEKKIYHFLGFSLLITIDFFCFHVINNRLLLNVILNILFTGALLLNLISGCYIVSLIYKSLKTYYDIDFENKLVKTISILFLCQLPFLVPFVRGILSIPNLLTIEITLCIIFAPILLLMNISQPKKEENDNEGYEYNDLEEKGNIENEDNTFDEEQGNTENEGNKIYDEEQGNTESVSNQYSFSKKDSDKEISYNNQSKLSKKLNNSKTTQIEYCPENSTPLENK